MKRFLAIALLLGTLVACNNQGNKAQENGASHGTISQKVKITTDFGDIIIGLYDETPKHRDNFVKLVEDGFYDSLIFHRVIESFMIQGGDPESKNAKPEAMLGNGGPGYQIDAEIVKGIYHKRGALAAARTSDQMNPLRKSSGSQFYIVQGKPMDSAQLVQIEQSIIQDKKRQLGMKFAEDTANKAIIEKLNGFQMEMQALQQQQKKEEWQKKREEAQAYYEAEFVTKVEATFEQMGGFAYTDEQKKVYSEIGGTPFLDQQYTVFGEVIEGMNIVDSIAAVKKGAQDRPVEDVRMYMSIVK